MWQPFVVRRIKNFKLENLKFPAKVNLFFHKHLKVNYLQYLLADAVADC
ncbi:MAG: hypothetical protein S4CHLAM7_14320 [Chlamydiae bacterium]|nr:hypothetical protein [Chlamydiota bacterium]